MDYTGCLVKFTNIQDGPKNVKFVWRLTDSSAYDKIYYINQKSTFFFYIFRFFSPDLNCLQHIPSCKRYYSCNDAVFCNTLYIFLCLLGSNALCYSEGSCFLNFQDLEPKC